MTNDQLKVTISGVEAKLQQHYAECREFEKTLMALNQMASGGSPMGASYGSLLGEPVATPAHHPSGLDFSRCQTINDKLIVVAQANEGLVETRQATNILWDVHVGKGTFESLFSNVKQRLSSRRTEWTRVGKGVYRYLHYLPTDQRMPDATPPPVLDHEPTEAPSRWSRPTGAVKTASAYPNSRSYSAGTAGAARRAAGRAAPIRVRTGTGRRSPEMFPEVADFGSLRPSNALPNRDTHQYIPGGLTGQNRTNILLGIPSKEDWMVNTLIPSVPPTALGPLDPDDGDAGRQQRGTAIAACVPIKETPVGYRVTSQSGNGSYVVTVGGEPFCTCPDFEKGRFKRPCKHIYAVALKVQRESGDSPLNDTNGTSPPPTPEPDPVDLVVPPAHDSLLVPPSELVLPSASAPPPGSPPPPADLTAQRPTYGQDWPLYNAGQDAEGEEFFRLLRALCNAVMPEVPSGVNGRPRLPLEDILFCAALKVYTRTVGRRGRWTVRYVHERGFLKTMPSCPSVWRYMADPSLFPWLYLAVVESAKPLCSVDTEFAPDSTGFSSSVFDRWFVHKWGRTVAETRWIKLHLMAGLRTQIVVAAEATDTRTADGPYLPGFLEIAVENFDKVETVVADKGYLSHANYDAIRKAGADGYIPFKKNSTPGPGHHKRDPEWERKFHQYHSRAQEFDEKYYKRERVETVFSQIKKTFGGDLCARVPSAQVNETMLKVLCHNIRMLNRAAHELGCTELFDPQPFR